MNQDVNNLNINQLKNDDEQVSKSQALPLNNLKVNSEKGKDNNEINSLCNSNVINDIKKKRTRKKLKVILTEDEEIYYYNLFQVLDEKNTGKLDAKQVATLMKKSGLSRNKLKTIWLIASQSSIIYLDRSEFYVILRLIALAQNNLPYTAESIENNTPVNLLPFLDFKINGNNEKVIYKITENHKNMYKRLFDNNKDNNDSISAKKAISIWKSTNVSDDIIRNVASIITPLKQKGFFNLKEFQVANYLFSISDKYEIPNKLPMTLTNFLENESDNNDSAINSNNTNNNLINNDSLCNFINEKQIEKQNECLIKLNAALQKANELTKENENLVEKINSHKEKINILLKEIDDFQDEQKQIKEKLKYINQECTVLIDFINNKKENITEEEKKVETNLKNLVEDEKFNNLNNQKDNINRKEESVDNINNKEELINNKTQNLNNVNNKEELINEEKENLNNIINKEEDINNKLENLNNVNNREELINNSLNKIENLDNIPINKDKEKDHNNLNDEKVIVNKKEFSFEECYKNSNRDRNDNNRINDENSHENKINNDNYNNMNQNYNIRKYNTSVQVNGNNTNNNNSYNTNNYNEEMTNESNQQTYFNNQNYSDYKSINTNYSIPNIQQYKAYWNNSLDRLKDPTLKMTETQRKEYQELEKKRNYFQNLFEIMSEQISNKNNKSQSLDKFKNEKPNINIYKNNNEIKCVQYNLMSNKYSNIRVHNIDATTANKKKQENKITFEINKKNKEEELNSNLNSKIGELFNEDADEKIKYTNEKGGDKEFDFDEKDYGFD